MALSRKECAQIRVAINRAATGPSWFVNAGEDPTAAEIRAATREWLRVEIVRHLQNMLPPNERVKLP